MIHTTCILCTLYIMMSTNWKINIQLNTSLSTQYCINIIHFIVLYITFYDDEIYKVVGLYWIVYVVVQK